MTDLLVTGAAGQLGQRVLHHLLDTLKVPASRIVAASRKPADLAAWTARGVAARAADFDDPASIDAAFAGVKRLLIISTDAVGEPGKRRAQHEAAVRAAKGAGVEHLVYTSMPQPERSPVLFAPDHLGTEQSIAASGFPGWTILRNNWYFENLFHAIPNALASGAWYSAAGEGRIAYIARDDLALAAATALAGDFNGQRTLTLSGGQSFSGRDVAALVAQATGKPLKVVDVPLDGIVQGAVGAGLPEPVARTFASFDEAAKGGFLDGDAKDFSALTGKAPQTLEPWIAANAGAFAGKQAA